MAPIQAYHVSDRADLEVIRPHCCDSTYYDGRLFGAEVASFTTTTWNGRLPTISPYPRTFDEGADCYQYTTTFDPADFFKFQMSRKDNQVHFLLLSRTSASEKAIAALLRLAYPDTEDLGWDLYFPDGQPNDSTGGGVFVNVFFMHEVNLTIGQRPNTVSRSNARATQNHVMDGDWIRSIASMAGRRQIQNQGDDDSDGLESLYSNLRL